MRNGYLAVAAAMLLGAGLSFASTAEAANYSVSTTGKNFEPAALNIMVGDTVTFVTEDYLGQAIYSLSPAKVFSLSSRTFSESETVRFNEPGTVKVRTPGQVVSTELTINIRSGG